MLAGSINNTFSNTSFGAKFSHDFREKAIALGKYLLRYEKGCNSYAEFEENIHAIKEMYPEGEITFKTIYEPRITYINDNEKGDYIRIPTPRTRVYLTRPGEKDISLMRNSLPYNDLFINLENLKEIRKSLENYSKSIRVRKEYHLFAQEEKEHKKRLDKLFG